MEKLMMRFVVIVGLPLYLVLDRVVDGQPWQESWAYYRSIMSTGELF